MKLTGLLIACALAASGADNTVTLLRNADVYPVTSPEMKGVNVLIENGKIAGIGAKIAAPKGARVIDAKGLRVYPGMIDSGTELGLSEIPAERVTVDTGELGEFMPQLRAIVAVNPDSEHFPVVRVNGITSAMTFPSSGTRGGGRGGGQTQYIAGQAALIHTEGWTWEEMAIDRSAAMHVIFPSLGRGGRGGFDSAMTEMFPGAAGGGFTLARRTYMQQVDRLNEFFDRARQYQKERAAKLPGFKPDLKLEAMIPVLEGRMPVAVAANRADVIRDAIAFADRQHVRMVLLQPREAVKVASELKAKNIPVIVGRVMALPDEEDAPYDQKFTEPGELYKAGVKIAFGTFTNEFVRDLPYQAAMAVAYGLPYEEALKCVTINAAEIWGHGAEIGSIEKGKFADLMVTDGDPLEIQTQMKYLFIKGDNVPLENKQTRLYERYKQRQ